MVEGKLDMKQIKNSRKNNTWICCVFMLAVVIMACYDYSAAGKSGGPYELRWSIIDGGGGRSAGGQYVLTGTIGQPDAAYSSSEKYELLGGFWPGGPLCIVEFGDFANFARQWRYGGSNLVSDLDGDGDVDFEDLRCFADNWLSCCPYKWSLD